MFCFGAGQPVPFKQLATGSVELIPVKYSMRGSIVYTMGAKALSCIPADFACTFTASVHAVLVSHQFHTFIPD